MVDSLRARLTLWYMLILGVLLLLFSLLLYWLLARHSTAHFDHVLANYARTAGEGFRGQMEENFGDANVATAHTLLEFRPYHLYLAIYRETEGGVELLGASHTARARQPGGEALIPVAPASELLAAARANMDPVMETVEDGEIEGGIRIALWRVADRGRAYVVVVTQSRTELIEELRAVRRYFYLCLPVMLLLAGAAGLLLADRSLAPVAQMSARAEHISAENLHERLPVANARDELGRLATVFNDLLARVNHAFDGMRELVADASHELRTPLSIIRGEAEVALSQEREKAEYRESLAVIEDEARRLSRLVDDLMVLARADAGQRRVRRESIYLNDLVEECVRKAQVLSRGKGIQLELRPGEDLLFEGDEELLRRMILNLLDNAIKYTPAGGAVRVGLEASDGEIRLEVADTGVGIPAEAAALVFDRFYRVEKSRTRAEGGAGLGLPIVKWVAEVHQGNVTVKSETGRGSIFVVRLPRPGSFIARSS